MFRLRLVISFLLAGVFLAPALLAQPMPPPAPNCIESNGDGSEVTITYTVPPLNGNLFDAYDFYYADSKSGPYNLVATLAVYGQNNIIISNIPLSSDPDYFYFVSRFNGGSSSANSDTIATIVPSISDPGNGTLDVLWNSINRPGFGTSSPAYSVFRRYVSVGPGYTLVGSTFVPDTLFTDTIRQCEDSVYYRIQQTDLTGCTSVSKIVGTYFVNPEPVTPFLERVTIIQATQQVLLEWERSTSRDTKGYYIYRFNSSGSPVLVQDNVGWNNTFWIDAASLATSQPECYRIAAYDSCNKVSDPGLTHCTIFLDAVLDKCTGICNLNWSMYQSWANAVQEYKIYVSQNGSPFALLATVPGNVSTYQHFPLIEGTVYAYYIEAIDGSNTFSSLSNFDGIVADVPVRPEFLYVKYVTVDGPSSVKGGFYHDIRADIIKYVVYQSKNEGDTWDNITEVLFDPFAPVLYFEDTTARTNRQSYLYKIVAIDSCSAEVLTSENIGKTIFLRAQSEISMENTITWSDYEEWVGGVRTYKAFRGFQGAFSDIPAGSVDFGINTWKDDVTNRMNQDGDYCYYVQAYQGLDTLYFFSDSSRSNIVCIKQDKTIYIPNAFTPDGINKEFKPYMTFINPGYYRFQVYNQWGERIFETLEPESGWDGTVNGKPARVDTYVYYIRYQNQFFQFKEERGTFLLIR